jgi:hypothetical protein
VGVCFLFGPQNLATMMTIVLNMKNYWKYEHIYVQFVYSSKNIPTERNRSLFSLHSVQSSKV